jgi:RND family efflux transporter MFP subunit
MKLPSLPLLSLLLAGLIAGCTRHDTPAPAANLPPVRVHSITVHVETIPVVTEVTGTVRPVQRAALAPKVMGAIADFPVALGQSVKAGDLLVKISAGEIAARVAQAQSQLNQARRDLERERDLLAKNASTAEMVRSLEDRYTMTEAMVREAEVLLGYAEIRAPFAGIVTRKNADAGDLASPGHPLLELEGTGAFEIDTGIPDSLAGGLAVGAEISVVAPAAGTSLTGRVTELSSAADPTARTVSARIAVPAGTAVRSGQFVRVQVPGAPARALLAPAAAVSVVGQLERVFVVGPDNRAVLRLVKTGARRGEFIEILSGLDDGERVVVAAPAELQEGRPLDVQP